MVHDPQEEIHDAKHGQFVMDLELGKSRKMRFSKTVVESLSRPTKQCANEPLGQETCIAQKVSKFLIILLYIRYPKEIMKMERHFSAFQHWLQK